MKVDKRWQDEIKLVDRGLYIEWDEKLYRWRVKHKDDRTGLVRDVFLVESKEGEYEDLNMGVVRLLSDCVMWEVVAKYPDPKDMYEHFAKQHEREKNAQKVRRHGYLIDFNRAHRTEWRAARENARSGRFYTPEERERKIIIC